MASEIKFCGLTVRGFKSNIGFGRNQLSSLTLDLVQDVTAGDVPNPVPDGFPCFFDFFGYSFYGLLQRFGVRKDLSGFPTYEAVLVDPREILEGAEIIINNYIGPVGIIPNVINAYGWWENSVGYGSSGATEDTGMPWNKIVTAVKNLVNSPKPNVYGAPLNFRGVRYGLDLSGMPTVPAYYTIGGGANIGLLDAISQVCEDCGCDYYVFLDGFNIRIKTISRLNQPKLGTISALVNSGFGNTLMRSESATEVRNETTSSFLIGGAVTQLYQTDLTAAASFWGYDSFSNPIFGAPGIFPIKLQDGKTVIDEFVCEFMNLNARGVEDILGTDIYPCSTFELLFAKYSYDSWSAFIASQRKDVAKLFINPFEPLANFVPGQRPLMNQVVNDGKVVAEQLADIVSNQLSLNASRFYEFVKGVADEFLGKKFVVQLPFILFKEDPQTLKITYSQEITDAGWQSEGSQPLDLSPINEDVFKAQDGRFNAFVRFFVDAVAQPVDFSQVSAADSVLELENNNLFLKCSVDPRVILLPDGTPYALITLPSAVFQEAVEATGGIGALLSIFGIPPAFQADAIDMFQKAFNPVHLHPSPIYPDAFAIPLKSNTVTYGPWFVAGAPGKTRVEQDSGLTPWNYGGEAALQLAATSRVASCVTNMQISESGQMEIADLPSASLGDVMAVDGPNLTNISVSYGDRGIVTTYRFETFTPRFYATLSKGASERIRKAGQASQQLRRSIRQQLRQTIGQQAAFAQRAPEAGFLAKISKTIKRESPHDTFVSWSGTDENGLTRTMLSSASYQEAIALSNANDDSQYQNTAVMTFNGLFRPFSNNYNLSGGSGLIPGYTLPASGFPNAISVTSLDPIGGPNDIEIYSWGNTYAGLNQRDRGADYSNSRALGLRGPIVVNGWGYDINLNPVPSGADGNFLPNVGWRAESYKAGPVDLLWDEDLGIWTSHDMMTGKANALVPVGWQGSFKIKKDLFGADSDTDINAVNYTNLNMASGDPVLLHFSYKAGGWLAVSPNVSGIGGGPPIQERLLKAISTTTIVGNGSGAASCYDYPYGTIGVRNYFTTDVAAGKRILIGYADRAGEWYVIAADCNSTGSAGLGDI